MAMATSSLYYTASLPKKSLSKQSPLHFPGACVTRQAFSSLKITTSSSSSSPLAVVAAATSAVEAEPQTAAAAPAKVLPFRVGHGFDLHRLEPGYPLIIGGINIPHDRGCEAHSDGDVLLHCVVDAILGALGLPDIGQIFPDTDPKWKGAASSVFHEGSVHDVADFAYCQNMVVGIIGCKNHLNSITNEENEVKSMAKVRLMHEAGYELGNLDATLILQRPKVSPHKEAIRSNLCKLLGADPSVVNLKAKTHEKVDSLGENRSIAAHTVVLLMRK
ncbi:hypothetical protein DH2020_028847 [Rehmannia glutinosa]|uniref:2-C-methyl-D-erythritol 2,4-cyclodiphosphate synthase n=1 Tax=Rehmannia glutinosa TaxID=99300 RepID=A0ABR0VR74_REHGL